MFKIFSAIDVLELTIMCVAPCRVVIIAHIRESRNKIKVGEDCSQIKFMISKIKQWCKCWMGASQGMPNQITEISKHSYIPTHTHTDKQVPLLSNISILV